MAGAPNAFVQIGAGAGMAPGNLPRSVSISGSAFVQIGNGLQMSVPAATHAGRNVPRFDGTGDPLSMTHNLLRLVAPTTYGGNNVVTTAGPEGRGLTHVVTTTPEGTLTLPLDYARHVCLTRHVTLTDFCNVAAERPGIPILALRHPADSATLALSATPAGRQPRDVETAWQAVTELSSTFATAASGSGGLRASLVSLTFLVAACSTQYANRTAADELRAHVIATSGQRDTARRLDLFFHYMCTLIRSHVFPHHTLTVLGGLLAWVAQDRLASLTMVARGPQEGARTDHTEAPRSSVHVPACAFLNVDGELRHEGEGVQFVYLLFVYGQRLHHEGFRVLVATTRLAPSMFPDALRFLFHRQREENVLRGTAGTDPPAAADGSAAFPLVRLSNDPRSPRCPAHRLTDAAATAPLFEWRPDMRGRPTLNSCMYAAYVRLGYIPQDLPRITCRYERFPPVQLPTVTLEHVTWSIGEWTQCYY